ncbi:betaine--homocysteine S-methyltransferase 1-like isoform X1 [Homarus americanus]|uniref:betaine--homocysteine S-methyltransferase 1-like isoform X1 n=1 Tax=Homarus americanus TaxID=6706 RepID=UPI001C47A721|nr:betaine--homocysteine S-methyltransferase 1-like isoform X1 [Homarus americanus]
MSTKKGLLERLREGPVIGDGGYVIELEKRGYVTAGLWTPEATVEHPEAVRQLHREFLRSGSDVIQSFSFFASGDRISDTKNKFTGEAINQAACNLAVEVAREGDALVCGGVCQTPAYRKGATKNETRTLFRNQMQVLVDNRADFLLCEYFQFVEEIELAIEVAKTFGLPVAASMCIGEKGSHDDVSLGQCAVRMARAGADVVGLNCHHAPMTVVENIKTMKKALQEAGLEPFLLTQPCGYHVDEAEKMGYLEIPEYPLAMEPRTITRWDCHRYARAAYDAGVRYLGGCCGFQPYHIRALAEELLPERGGRRAPAMDKHYPWGGGQVHSFFTMIRRRSTRDYWENLQPATGRPRSSAFSKCDTDYTVVLD